MTGFQLNSPEPSIALTAEAIAKIRAVLTETRDRGVRGGVGLDVIGEATDVGRQLDELAAEYDCVVEGFYDSDDTNGGGYFLFARRDAPDISDDCWLSKPEPVMREEFPSYRGVA